MNVEASSISLPKIKVLISEFSQKSVVKCAPARSGGVFISKLTLKF